MTVQTHTFDAAAVMKVSAAVVATGAESVIHDSGPGIGHRILKILCDITAIKVSAGDEIYDIVVQGSPDLAFTAATIVDLGSITLADAAVQRTDMNQDNVVGRRSIIVENLDESGDPLRFIRLFNVQAGTAESITYSARLVVLDITA